jgi:hypothetical protein
MDVWSLTRAALRRWYVLLPALLITALLTSSAGNSAAPEYETTGAALMVPPAVAADVVNPYSSSSGPEVLRTIVSGSAVRGRLAAQGLESGYELTITSRTPIFNITVRSEDRQRALGTGAAVIEALRQELTSAQADFGVPPSAMATVQVIDAPDTVTSVGSGAVRIKAVVALLGVIGSVALAVTFDDLLLLVRRRRQSFRAGRASAAAARSHRRPEQRDRVRVSA